ncbi:pre-rRNA processing [Coemansia sp. Benny D115]|nr:pre-rRNA processing [Coemansia sp. Benny D115]
MDGSPVATAAPPLQQSTDSSSAEDTPRQPTRRTRASRFSVLLEGSVDYASYRAAYGRKYLQQQPHFDSVRDAEIELKCVLHDETFCQPGSDGSIMAENVALAVDWFISALVLLFDCEEPFQNPDFLQLCCMFFASPLYENNARLVQRHLVKRAYAELNVGPEDTYESTLWLLLAFLHLITEFQPDTHLLCKDSGLFPLLQRLVLGCAEKHLHVLAMSLMFEVAQAVTLSQTDFAYVTDELLLFLLDYIERMRYADSDVYNNTGTKLVLALNEQFLRLDGYASMPQSPVVSASNNTHHPGTTTTNGSSGMLWVQHRELIDRLSKTGAGPSRNYVAARRDSNTLPPTSAMRSMHIRTASANVVSPTQQQYPHQQQQQQQQQPDDATLENRGGANLAPPHSTDTQGSRPTPATSPRSVALRRLPSESNMLPRSRSMDFRVPPLQKQQSESHRDPSCCIQRATSECYEEKGTSIHAALADNKKSKSSCCSPRGGIAPRIFPTSTPVVAILANRIDCCKTFTENLVFLLNRETDPSTQILILHMLNCILADPSTAGILYTNDMHVLIDIVLRDLNNLADSMQQLKQAYLLVVGALLRNPSYLTTRHRLSDIELCLVGMLRHALECSQEPPLPVISRSRRGSASSSASTRHNSMASDVLVLPMSGLRRESGAVSPVSSLSSSMSEETCCPRSVDDQPLLGSTSHKQHMRRPAPPPPPSRRKPGDSSHSRVSTSSDPQTIITEDHHRHHLPLVHTR